MITKAQIAIINELIDRAENEGVKAYDRLTMTFVLGKAVELFDLSLEDMMKANNFNFYHDYVQLPLHFDMRTGIFDNRFLPRCVKSKKQPTADNSEDTFEISSDTRQIDNWIRAVMTWDGVRYKVTAKLFDEESVFGIDNGRISKLTVRSEKDDEEIINYDRGWDKYPRDQKLLSMLKRLIKELNELPIIWRK